MHCIVEYAAAPCVPALQALRGEHTHTATLDAITAASMQLELVATFAMPRDCNGGGGSCRGAASGDTALGGAALPFFGVDVLVAMDNGSAVSLLVDCSAPAADADCHIVIDATAQVGLLLYAGGSPM